MGGIVRYSKVRDSKVRDFVLVIGIEKGGESDGEGIVEIKFRLGEENTRV